MPNISMLVPSMLKVLVVRQVLTQPTLKYMLWGGGGGGGQATFASSIECLPLPRMEVGEGLILY